MKSSTKRNLLQLSILLVLAIILVLSIVFPTLPITTNEHNEMTEISVVLGGEDGEFFSGMRLGMEQAAADLDGVLRVFTPAQGEEHAQQKEIISAELSSGTGAIVVIPADGAQMESFLSTISVDVPLVSVHTELSDNITCISPDYLAVGKEFAAGFSQGDFPVLVLDTFEGDTDLENMMNGFVSEMAEEKYTVKTLAAQDISGELPQLLADGDYHSIISFEPNATEAVISLTSDKQISVYCAGVSDNIIDALDRQEISAVAAWSDYALGYLAVEAAILDSEKTSTVSIDFRIIRTEEMYEPDNEKLLFPINS